MLFPSLNTRRVRGSCQYREVVSLCQNTQGKNQICGVQLQCQRQTIFLCSVLWCQGDIKDQNLNPLLHVRKSMRRSGREGSDLWHVPTIIVGNIGASYSGEVPKIPCFHVTPAPVSEHFSFLFSQGICKDLIFTCGTHLLGSHFPAMENGSGPWIICSQSLTL